MAETEEREKAGVLGYMLCGESGEPVKVEGKRAPEARFLSTTGERSGEGMESLEEGPEYTEPQIPCRLESWQSKSALLFRGPVDEWTVSWYSLVVKNIGSDYMV